MFFSPFWFLVFHLRLLNFLLVHALVSCSPSFARSLLIIGVVEVAIVVVVVAVVALVALLVFTVLRLSP